MSGPLPPEGPRPGWPTSPPVAQPLPPPALSPGAFASPGVAGSPTGPAGAPLSPQAWQGPPHYAPTPVVADPRWSASKMFLVVWGLASLVGPFLGVVAGLAFVAVLGVDDIFGTGGVTAPPEFTLGIGAFFGIFVGGFLGFLTGTVSGLLAGGAVAATFRRLSPRLSGVVAGLVGGAVVFLVVAGTGLGADGELLALTAGFSAAGFLALYLIASIAASRAAAAAARADAEATTPTTPFA